MSSRARNTSNQYTLSRRVRCTYRDFRVNLYYTHGSLATPKLNAVCWPRGPSAAQRLTSCRGLLCSKFKDAQKCLPPRFSATPRSPAATHCVLLCIYLLWSRRVSVCARNIVFRMRLQVGRFVLSVGHRCRTPARNLRGRDGGEEGGGDDFLPGKYKSAWSTTTYLFSCNTDYFIAIVWL